MSETTPPPLPQEQNRIQAYACDGCGAEMTWDAAGGCLKCAYCGSTRAVEATAGGARELDLDEALTTKDLARGYGIATRTLTCKGCSATVSFAEKTTTTRCAFCGSAYLAEPSQHDDVIRPETVIPFRIAEEEARRLFRDWVGKGWFTPSDLKHLARVDALRGVYTPFWTFDANASSQWTAEAGHYYYVSVPHMTMVNGKRVSTTRQERRVRWEPAAGRRQDHYDDVLIPGSHADRFALIERVYPYELQHLTPYKPEFLAGWLALEPDTGLKEAAVIGHAQMRTESERRCAGDVPGDTHRNLNVRTQLSALTFKHALLPLWICAFLYQGKKFPFLVNGQTGKVSGKKPVSWIKVTLFVLAILAVIAVLIVCAGLGGQSHSGQ